jgi:nicotinamide mononucleotide transporter
MTSNHLQEKGEAPDVQFSPPRRMLVAVLICAVLAVVAGAFVSRLHLYLPAAFPERASYPYLDALTTVMSFTAMWLMVRKRVESWLYWIAVNVIGIGLYYAKAVGFVSLLYVVLLFLAVKGLVSWVRAARVS